MFYFVVFIWFVCLFLILFMFLVYFYLFFVFLFLRSLFCDINACVWSTEIFWNNFYVYFSIACSAVAIVVGGAGAGVGVYMGCLLSHCMRFYLSPFHYMLRSCIIHSTLLKWEKAVLHKLCLHLLSTLFFIPCRFF